MLRFHASMRRLIPTALLGLTLFWTAACQQQVAGPEVGPDAIADLSRQVNDYRASIGCQPLGWHRDLSRVAQRHSQDMVDRGFFGHVNPDGKNPFDRIREAGVAWSGPAGENLAASSSAAGTVLGLWLDSPGHKANLDECDYTHHAVGLYDGRWTHVFIANPSG